MCSCTPCLKLTRRRPQPTTTRRARCRTPLLRTATRHPGARARAPPRAPRAPPAAAVLAHRATLHGGHDGDGLTIVGCLGGPRRRSASRSWEFSLASAAHRAASCGDIGLGGSSGDGGDGDGPVARLRGSSRRRRPARQWGRSAGVLADTSQAHLQAVLKVAELLAVEHVPRRRGESGELKRNTLALAVAQERARLAGKRVVEKGREVRRIEFECPWHLLAHVPHALDELKKDGGQLLVGRRMRAFSSGASEPRRRANWRAAEDILSVCNAERPPGAREGWRRRAAANGAPEILVASPATSSGKTLEAIPRAEQPSSRSCAIAVTCAVRSQPSEQWTRTEERPRARGASPSPPLAAHRARARSTCRADWRGQWFRWLRVVAVADGPDFSSSPSQPCSSRSPRHGKGAGGDRGSHQREERLERRTHSVDVLDAHEQSACSGSPAVTVTLAAARLTSAFSRRQSTICKRVGAWFHESGCMW